MSTHQYSVWPWATARGGRADAREYLGPNPKSVAVLRAEDDYAGDPDAWPRSYSVRDDATGVVVIVDVDVVLRPTFVARRELKIDQVPTIGVSR